MKIKAKISFCGLISMYKGEIRDVEDLETANDLIIAGYVEEIKVKAKAAIKDEN